MAAMRRIGLLSGTVTELLSCIESIKASAASRERVFVLFSGSTDAVTGHSWCSDCVRAEPVIEKVVSEQLNGGVFITCIVGDRPSWKDMNNCFRTDSHTKLKGVPTLMEWNTVRRIEPEQCANEDLVRMIFEEDD